MLGREGQKSCDGCGDRKPPYIQCYWEPSKAICVNCCFEKNREFDGPSGDWPENGRLTGDQVGPAFPERVLAPGITLGAHPITVPRRGYGETEF